MTQCRAAGHVAGHQRHGACHRIGAVQAGNETRTETEPRQRRRGQVIANVNGMRRRFSGYCARVKGRHNDGHLERAHNTMCMRSFSLGDKLIYVFLFFLRFVLCLFLSFFLLSFFPTYF